jgi:putative transcriptional regulator
MTQKGLAELIGVSRQTVNAIEGNKYPPTLEVAFRIARVFGMSIEDIFFYEPDVEGEHPFADGLEVVVTWDGDDPNGGK